MPVRKRAFIALAIVGMFVGLKVPHGEAALPAPLNKDAVKCQRTLLHDGAGFLKAKLQALDRCTNGILTCVQTKPADEKCVPKALSKCSKNLSSLRRAEERFAGTVAKKCGPLGSGDLTSAEGLGFGEAADSCLAEFGLDVADADSLYQCVLRRFGRAGENLFAVQQARVRELLEFAVVQPLPLCNLPNRPSPCCAAPAGEAAASCSCLLEEDVGSCAPGGNAPQCALGSPDQAKKVVKCAAAIAKGGTALAKALLASSEKCVKALLACEQTAKPEKQAACREKAQKLCGKGFGQLGSLRAKFDTVVDKSCGVVDEGLLVGPSGLALASLTGPCGSQPLSLASYKECLREQHQCEVCEALHGAVPGLAGLLAVNPIPIPADFCFDPARPAQLCSTPEPAATPAMVASLAALPRTAGIPKFLRGIVNNTAGKPGLRVEPGGFRPPQGQNGGKITGIKARVPRFIPTVRVQTVTVNYEPPTGTDPRLLLVAKNADGEAFDLFRIPLSNGGSDEVVVEFDDSFGECVRLEFATAEGEDGDVSPYVPLEQVPEGAPLASATQTPSGTITPTPTTSPATIATPSETMTLTTTPAPSSTSSTPTPTPTATPPGIGLCDEGVIAEPVPMLYGADTTSCTISPSSDIDVFKFQGTVGDSVRVVVASTGFGSLDMRLEVRDPDGIKISDASCNAPNSNSNCAVAVDAEPQGSGMLPTLAKTGQYLITISDVGGNNTGSYSLHLERFLPDTPPSIPLNSNVVSSINPGVDIDTYVFDGTSGDDIRIVAASTSFSSFDVRLEVRDPDGIRIVDTFCNAPNSNSNCSLAVGGGNLLPVLTKTGQYVVSISDAGADDTGSYGLHVERFHPAAPPIITTTSDSISPSVDIDSFGFQGHVGDDVRVVVSSTSFSSLDMRVEVRDPDGTTLVDASCNAPNSNSNCSVTVDSQQPAPNTFPGLTKAGLYVVSVSDAGGDNTGNYNVTVQCLFGPCLEP